MSDLCFYRDPEEMEKEDHVAAEKAVTKEGFQGRFTGTQPEVWWHAGALCAYPVVP